MKLPCRCRKCGARKSLNHKPECYQIPPRCPSCYARTWRIDKWRLKHEYGVVCNCGGYWFPHRDGSKFCHHNPHYEDAINNEGKYHV